MEVGDNRTARFSCTRSRDSSCPHRREIAKRPSIEASGKVLGRDRAGVGEGDYHEEDDDAGWMVVEMENGTRQH